MPSHSKKQHNFMEAIAHSPSFAKKAGVPQSVGKDYAAADKGKTFSKGGEMKESKGMVGKEVAFMKKKGAPKSMIKHEEAEMKGMKRGGRVRRMADGGLGSSEGYGDPFANKTEFAPGEGDRNVDRIKNFFGFGKKKDEEAAPNKNPESTVGPPPSGGGKRPLPVSASRVQSPRISSGNTEDSDAVEREDAASLASTRAMNEANKQKKNAMDAFNPALAEAQKQKENAMAAFKPKPRKPVGVEKTVKKERVITEPAEKTSTGATFKSDLEGRLKQMKEPRKFGVASDETREAVRKGLGSALDFFNLSKRHEQEFAKKAAKGGSVKRMRYGGSPDDGMDMGQPMRGAPRPVPAPPMNPNSIAALQAQYGTRGPGGGNDMNAPRYPGMKKGGKVKMAMGGETMGPRNMSQDVEKGSNKDIAHGEHGLQKRGKTRAMMPKMKGSPIGDVPAFAKGGMVGRASSRGDGIASKGRTRGKLC